MIIPHLRDEDGRPVVVPELRPCPFCGNVDQVYTHHEMFDWYHVPLYYVRCGKCACYGPFGKSDDEGIALWNRRPIAKPAAQQEGGSPCP